MTPVVDTPASCVPVNCPPALFADGGFPAGSLPPIVATDVVGPGPDWPMPCGGFMVPYGPQADLLVTNTTDCSFALGGMVTGTPYIYTLDAGTRVQVGWALAITGINLPPAPVTDIPSTFGHAGANEVNRTAALFCGDNLGSIVTIPPGLFALAPGDFVWVSIITLLYIAGSGAGTVVTPIVGVGPTIAIRGERL